MPTFDIDGLVLSPPAHECFDNTALLANRSRSVSDGKFQEDKLQEPRAGPARDTIDLFPLKNLSPGEKAKLEMAIRILSKPDHRFNREGVHAIYGIQLPTISSKAEDKRSEEQTGRAPVQLEKFSRHPPKAPSKLVRVEEIRNSDNVCDLFQRGLIPPTAQVVFDPPVMRSRKAQLHDVEERQNKQMLSMDDLCPIYQPGNQYQPTKAITAPLIRVDTDKPKHLIYPKMRTEAKTEHAGRKMDLKKVNIGETEALALNKKSALKSGNAERPTETSYSSPPNTTPATDNSPEMTHWLSVKDGLFQVDTPEYVAFEQEFQHKWKRQGRQFKGKYGQTRAAITIQTNFRRIRAQKAYKEYRRRRGAACVILRAWRRHLKLLELRKRFAQKRKENVEHSEQRLKAGCFDLTHFALRLSELGKKWKEFLANPHVLIHLPSVGYSEEVRQYLRDSGDLEYMERRQIARLCEVRNPNTYVVCITHAAISDDLLEYYEKLLGLAGAIRTGKESDQKLEPERYRILVPEFVEYFQESTAPPLCLATLLYYSPRALRHIRNFIGRRPALIVPGFGNHLDQYAVASVLRIPVWTSKPQITNLFTLQSTSRRLVENVAEEDLSKGIGRNNSVAESAPASVFSSILLKPGGVRDLRRRVLESTKNKDSSELAVNSGDSVENSGMRQVVQPPGNYDIFTLEHLHEAMADLFTENLPTKNWLIKIDNGVCGHGTATLCIQNLRSFDWAVSQRHWYGPARWAKKWAQEPTQQKFMAEVPDLLNNHLKPHSTTVYADSKSFIAALLTHVPTSSVDPFWLNSVCKKLGAAMKRKGFMGHFTIDLVTFIDPNENKQQLWVTGIRPGYSDSLAMMQLVLFASDAEFRTNPVTGAHEILSRPPGKEKEMTEHERTATEASNYWFYVKRSG
ncbi:unnamed protein product [Calicophoron daubneyi]|uniref:IQCH-like ATP-grasp domain-containing protein n=1 Tax=Calicophoron daubneyi TaxID=300641 RepID=A0AAV2SVJ2_CALDB